MCGQIHTPASLLPSKNLGVEQDGPQKRSGRFGEEKNLSRLSEFLPQIVQPVAQSQYRLRSFVSEFEIGLWPHPISNLIFCAATCGLISEAFMFLRF